MNDNEDIFLSIIIPAYNVEKYIDVLLEKLVPQLVDNMECIIVDDGSTDSTKNILELWSQRENKVIVIEQENGGNASARQKGLDVSSGVYITFIDSDDTIDEDYIQKLITMINENPEKDIYFSGFRIIDFDGNVYDVKSNSYNSCLKRNSFLSEYIRGNIQGGNSLYSHIYSRKFIDKHEINFDKNVRFSVDFLFNVECFKHIDSIYLCDYVGYSWCRREGTVTTSFYDNTVETAMKCIESASELCKMIGEDEAVIKDFLSKTKIFFFDYCLFKIENSSMEKKEKQKKVMECIIKLLDNESIRYEWKGYNRLLIYCARITKSYYPYGLYRKILWSMNK